MLNHFMKFYILNQKAFYNMDCNYYQYCENILLSEIKKEGIFEIFHVFFHINEISINVLNSTGVLYISECIFEECFPNNAPEIQINCKNNEFDISISKTCFYNCGINTIRCISAIGSKNSFAHLKDLSITKCQELSSMEYNLCFLFPKRRINWTQRVLYSCL